MVRSRCESQTEAYPYQGGSRVIITFATTSMEQAVKSCSASTCAGSILDAGNTQDMDRPWQSGLYDAILKISSRNRHNDIKNLHLMTNQQI
jgi:hypothetical protein